MSNKADLVDLTLTHEIRSLAVEQGLDMVGIAPVERFSEVPEGFRPQDYLPGAQTVISIACAIADAFCDTWGTYEDEGRSPLPYMYYGLGNVYWELARVANRIARRVEYKGYKSLPFPPHWSVSHFRSITTEPTGWPLVRANNAIPQDFPHLTAAVAAGLGKLGWNGLVLTRDFGARVRFNSVITTAPLAVDSLEAETICQPERCGFACAKACPAGALSDEVAAGREISIAGETSAVSPLDVVRCHYGLDGLVAGSGGRTKAEIPEGPGDPAHYRQTFANRSRKDNLINSQPRGTLAGNFCERCLLECPAHTWGRKPQEVQQ